MANPEELEEEMQIREAQRKFREQIDTHMESLGTISKIQFGYYQKLKEGGFSAQEAIFLCAQYHPLKAGQRSQD